MKHPPHWPLALDEVRYVGDGVVAVVARDARGGARRGRARWSSTTTTSPSVLDLEDARSDRVLVHSDLGTNRAYTWDLIPDLGRRRRRVRRRPCTR